MAFNINQFRAVVNYKGVAKTNLFEAMIIPPAGISGGDILTLECESVSIPDLGVGVQKIMPHGHGHGVQRPSTSDFTNISCNFIVDGEFNAKNFFYAWMQKIVNYDNSNYNTKVGGLYPYEFGFMNDYSGAIELKVFPDNKKENYYEYRFGNAFPTNIGSIEVAWSNDAQYMILPVSFAYNIYSNSTLLPSNS